MFNWDFKKFPDKKDDKVLFIRLLGQYGIQNEMVIEIPDKGSYQYSSDKRTVETFDDGGNLSKIYVLPSTLTAEISEVEKDFIDYQDFHDFNFNEKEYN